MRFLYAFAGALFITVAVFLFMQGLIERGTEARVELAVHTPVEIFRSRMNEPEPEELETEIEEPPVQPTLDALDIPSPSPPSAEVSTKLEVPALALGVGDFSLQNVGDRWSAPLGAASVPVAGAGDALGYVEVVPFNTRRPNVPAVAWQNKVSGWVLVAFSITPKGSTRDVRVLDANPKGVFEEKVVAAVQDWQYQLSFSGKSRGEIILTQKVEVSWQNYPQNIPNVD